MKTKSIIVIFLIAIVSHYSEAQEFSFNFLGEDFQLYRGVQFKLKNNATSGFSNTFYGDLKYCQKIYDDNVLYPDTEYKFKTVKDSLLNRVFILEDIIDKNGNSYNSTSNTFDNPIFILKDISTKQIIYFKYSIRNEFDFPFNTTKIIFSENDLCSKIERKLDDFENIIKLNTPLFSNHEILPMIIYKDIKGAKSTYYLSLRTHGSTAVVDGTDVTILFTDGTKWTKKVSIDVDATSEGFKYSAFVTLTPLDLITFENKKVKKFKLYIFERDINSIDSDKFKIYAKCIKNAK